MRINDGDINYSALQKKVKNLPQNYPFNWFFTIEAFPRTANSFLTSTLVPLLKGSHSMESSDVIFHHTHKIETILFSLENNIPTLSVIRNPLDAVCSIFLYYDKKQPLSALIERWLLFYTPILKLLETDNIHNLLLVNFDDVIKRPNYIIQAVNSKFELDLPLLENIIENEKKIFEAALIRSKKAHGENYKNKVGIPVNERKEGVDDIKNEIKKEDKYLEAIRVYDRLIDSLSKFN